MKTSHLLFFLPLDRWRFYVVAKVSNGKDGWLWYLEDSSKEKTRLVVALGLVAHGGLCGLQLALGPLGVFVLWATRDARKQGVQP